MFLGALGLMQQYSCRKSGLSLQRVFYIGYKPCVMTSPSGLQMAPVSYHMTKHMPFTLVPRVVANIDDEQTALYVHAVFGLREPEVGK